MHAAYKTGILGDSCAGLGKQKDPKEDQEVFDSSSLQLPFWVEWSLALHMWHCDHLHSRYSNPDLLEMGTCQLLPLLF